ncbi:MAG TPA: Tm-1-like ATP-binding domain-containing protein [Gemmataceae bacterium]|nr:Tm-1-like ATP-binding domain-containing protein [Gemmataceae bacterium]
MPVLLVGTLDTKGVEIQFVRDLLTQAGVDTLVLDAGVMGPPAFTPDVPRERVFAAAGTSLEEIQRIGDRGRAIEAAARGAAACAQILARDVTGILGLGGSAGTTIGTAVMRAFPFGVPKLMVSTLASGQVRPFVGVRDIMMMNSVVDISGLNRISRTVLTSATNAIIGMVKRPAGQVAESGMAGGKPLVTATMFGVTTPCVEAARKILETHDYEVLVFHATGVGGMTMESFIRDGLIRGVLDLTTTELADELVGGVLSAGRDRLTAAGLSGVPQVISLGALDMVNFGPPETVPEQFRARRFYQHNPNVTLMRTTPEENDQLGKEIAHKASAARGPTAVLVPLKGVSALDAEGKPFWWPEADAALFQSLHNWMSPQVRLIELDLHINDAAFAEMAARTLQEMIEASRER